jgi:hypothetical protein
LKIIGVIELRDFRAPKPGVRIDHAAPRALNDRKSAFMVANFSLIGST